MTRLQNNTLTHLIELANVPTLMKQLIVEKEKVEEIAKMIHTATNYLYLCRWNKLQWDISNQTK